MKKELTLKYMKFNFYKQYRAESGEYEPEWPPTPWRMFNAFVQAFHNTRRAGMSSCEYPDVLKKMQTLPVTVLADPSNPQRRSIGRFVPANIRYEDQQASQKGMKGFPFKRVKQNFHAVNSPYVVYGLEVDGEDWLALRSLMPWVDHLGRADSTCSVTEYVPDGHYRSWVVDENGNRSLRCPSDGCLKKMDMIYARKSVLSSGDIVMYKNYKHGNVMYKNGELIQYKKRWEQSYILATSASWPLTVEHCSLVAAGIRTALVEVSDSQGRTALSEELRSHELREHIGFSAIPCVFGKKADLGVKGVMVSLPASLAALRDDLESCLYSLSEFRVKDRGLEYCGMELMEPSPRSMTLNSDRWCGMGRVWQNVTPVQLPFYRASSGLGREEYNVEVVKQYCVNVGLPEPEKVEFPELTYGGRKAMSLFIRRSAACDRTEGFRTNVKITFPIEVPGPVLLGWDSNFGWGLFVRDASAMAVNRVKSMELV